MKTKYLLPILVLAISLSTSANIINIPADYATIQAGIDSSSNGDTVLVQPGTYIENINFNGHNIVLASLYLTTGDTSNISQTIIDGDSAGSVVTFENEEDSTTVLVGFLIRNGFASTGQFGGAGIFCENYANPVICHNIIKGNIAIWNGGGIFNGSYNGAIINDNIIEENFAKLGGGIFCPIGAYSKIFNNIINNNIAKASGGGLYVDEGESIIYENVISNNTILEQSIGYYAGAGMYFCGDSAYYNLIYGNSTLESGIGGGVMCSGHGVLASNIIYDNRAFLGGGVLMADSSALCANNTIYGNTAFYQGGGIAVAYFAPPTVINTISRNNTPNDIYLSEYSNIYVRYSNIQGGWPGEGNIDCNPMFCNPGEANFHIADVSCCVGAGEGGVDIGALGIGCYALEYLAGDANMFNGLWPPQTIGADVTYLVNYFRSITESCDLSGVYLSADANGDCNIIGSDVTRMVNYFRGTADISWCPMYPPAWLTTEGCPEVAPENWPNCE